MEAPERGFLIKTCLLIFCIPLFYIGIRYACALPGFPGECFRFIAGAITSPFLMEATIAFLGLIILLWMNGVRRQREAADEFVSREELERRTSSET